MGESYDEYSTDDGKRKRGDNGDPDGQIKVRKIHKTPDKDGKHEEKLGKILDLLRDLSLEVKGLRKEQKDYRNDIIELKKGNKILIEQNREMECKLELLGDRIDKLENEKRRNNLIVQGLAVKSDNQDELKTEIAETIKKHLGIEVKITGDSKLGPRTCLVELENAEVKKNVMMNKNKLGRLVGEKIYINDDLSKKDREIQGHIRGIASAERKDGKNVKIGYRKLFIEGEKWVWNDNQARLQKEADRNILLQVLPKN
ncbi:hypothetical protein HHI36_011181 [Cryptolaemus montrouzieri]|uniref:Uncharacterized protein n=1 Tax=Cryptolaemus montrouzieri TaxID=559131 RepID=A0ABD2MKX8_9CUCU